MTATLAERVCAHPFAAGLPMAAATVLAQDAVAVTFGAGDRIFTENEAADRFWFTESGSVALDMLVPGRGDQVVETLSGRTVLGWSWLCPPDRWHFGALAREPVSALAFDARSVRRRCETDPVFGYAVLNSFLPVVVSRLQATRLRVLDLYGEPAA